MMEHLDNIGLLCGVIFLAAAALMKIFPPHKINSLYGYRTASSMRSDAHWQFAQQYSIVRTIESGLFLLVVGVALEIIPTAEQVKLAIGLIALLSVPFYLFLRTERAIKKKFPQ